LDEIDVIDEEDNDNEEIKEDPTIYEVEFEKMMNFLAEFSSQDEPDALKFLGLTNNQRKSLHISCTRLKLKSESIGEGQIKETIVFRKEKKIKKMSTSTTQKKRKEILQNSTWNDRNNSKFFVSRIIERCEKQRRT